MLIPRWAIVVLVILFAVLLIALIRSKKRCNALEYQSYTADTHAKEQSSDFQNKERLSASRIQDLVSQCAALKENLRSADSRIAELTKQNESLLEKEDFVEKWGNAPEIYSENENLAEQLREVSEELSRLSEMIYMEHERDFVARRYTYSEDLFALPDSTIAQKLEDARALCEVLVNNGSAVEPIDPHSELPKGAEALLLSAFNGYADSLIDRLSSRTNYLKVANRLNLAFYLTNERGRNAVGAVIAKRYLEAKLDVLRCTQAFNEYKRLLDEQDKNRREAEKEDARRLQELRKKEQEVEQQEAMYERALAQVRAQLAGSITYQEKLALEKHIKDLEAELAAARDAKRDLTAAQLGRKGHVYVLSNIGSFGQGVYKIGMTRRLDPMARVRDLNIASTPFPFDVHAFIATDDAPALEAELHRIYADKKLNLTTSLNEREFYRVNLDELRKLIEEKGLKANWKMEATAEQYYESEQIRLSMAAGKKPAGILSANAVSPASVKSHEELNPVHNAENICAPSNGNRLKMEYSSVDALAEDLTNNGIDYVDKRNAGGNLWIQSATELDQMIERITVNGNRLYKVQSSKALHGEPGWFIK